MDYFRRIFLLTCLSGMVTTSFGQTAGSGFQNLLLTPDAAYQGSGQSNSALITGSQSVFISGYIPRASKLSQDISFRFQSYPGGLDHISISSRLSLFGSPVQLGWQKLNASDLEFREKPGLSQGNFEVYWMTFALGTSFQWDESDIGLTVKYSLQQLFMDSNDALAADISFSHPVMRQYSLHYISILNLGQATKLGNQAPNLPLQIKSGWLFYEFEPASWMSARILNEMSWLVHDSRFVSNLGTELTFLDNAVFRTGYRINHDSNPFSLGASFRTGSFNLDYSFSYYEYNLSPGHSFGLTWKL